MPARLDRQCFVGEAKTFRSACACVRVGGLGHAIRFSFQQSFSGCCLWWLGVVVRAGRVLLLLLFVVGCGVVGLLVNCIVVASIFVFCFLCFVSFFGRMVDALAS